MFTLSCLFTLCLVLCLCLLFVYSVFMSLDRSRPAMTSWPYLNLPWLPLNLSWPPFTSFLGSPALVQLFEEVVDLVEVWPHLRLLRPTLLHDVDGVGGRRTLRHRRPDHRGRLLEAGDDLWGEEKRRVRHFFYHSGEIFHGRQRKRLHRKTEDACNKTPLSFRGY